MRKMDFNRALFMPEALVTVAAKLIKSSRSLSRLTRRSCVYYPRILLNEVGRLNSGIVCVLFDE
jgi:hypothetical protein